MDLQTILANTFEHMTWWEMIVLALIAAAVSISIDKRRKVREDRLASIEARLEAIHAEAITAATFARGTCQDVSELGRHLQVGTGVGEFAYRSPARKPE